MSNIIIQIGRFKNFPGNSLSLTDVSPLRNHFSFWSHIQKVFEDRLRVDFGLRQVKLGFHFGKGLFSHIRV